MLNPLKWILAELFSIWRGRYQSMQIYLRAGFSSPAQASFFLIYAGDNASPARHAKAWCSQMKI